VNFAAEIFAADEADVETHDALLYVAFANGVERGLKERGRPRSGRLEDRGWRIEQGTRSCHLPSSIFHPLTPRLQILLHRAAIQFRDARDGFVIAGFLIEYRAIASEQGVGVQRFGLDSSDELFAHILRVWQ
jgi:hypothetical protein